MILAIQMGSSEGRAVLQLEDEDLVRSEHFDRKTSSSGAAPQGSSYDVEEDDDSPKSILNSIRKNIQIVFFSNKLNILVPCGPLAIVVNELTDHHVSFQTVFRPQKFYDLYTSSCDIVFQGWIFILSLLGIIPLAERLGWATE